MSASSSVARNAIRGVRKLGFPFETLDPFLFCVHHRDLFPKGDGSMRVPNVKGNGQDFDWSKDFRMYHGTEGIPGFPQHPHRGFETLTATTMGVVDHTDSTGAGGRYGFGDLQWMTAGSGVVHGEMFPLVSAEHENHMELFQIWLNLPAKSKFAKPHFLMHWHENIEHFKSGDGLTDVTVWVGELHGAKGQAPPPESWAADPESDVAVQMFKMQPGASVEIPAAKGGSSSNRALYFYAGKKLTVEDRDIPPRHIIECDASKAVTVSVPESADEETGMLLLQGRPIGEPVVQHGPFVMNTRQEIQQAFLDYQRTQFGGWPWPRNAVTFPADKGRFALQDGVETYPPGSSKAVKDDSTKAGASASATSTENF